MKRPYFRYQRAWTTDDGYPVKRALMVTADPPGPFRHWSNVADFLRTAKRIMRELRGGRR